jgi:hypothetical protein
LVAAPESKAVITARTGMFSLICFCKYLSLIM